VLLLAFDMRLSNRHSADSGVDRGSRQTAEHLKQKMKQTAEGNRSTIIQGAGLITLIYYTNR
jgi:hypothetical protein